MWMTRYAKWNMGIETAYISQQTGLSHTWFNRGQSGASHIIKRFITATLSWSYPSSEELPPSALASLPKVYRNELNTMESQSWWMNMELAALSPHLSYIIPTDRWFWLFYTDNYQPISQNLHFLSRLQFFLQQKHATLIGPIALLEENQAAQWFLLVHP